MLPWHRGSPAPSQLPWAGAEPPGPSLGMAPGGASTLLSAPRSSPAPQGLHLGLARRQQRDFLLPMQCEVSRMWSEGAEPVGCCLPAFTSSLLSPLAHHIPPMCPGSSCGGRVLRWDNCLNFALALCVPICSTSGLSWSCPVLMLLGGLLRVTTPSDTTETILSKKEQQLKEGMWLVLNLLWAVGRGQARHCQGEAQGGWHSPARAAPFPWMGTRSVRMGH